MKQWLFDRFRSIVAWSGALCGLTALALFSGRPVPDDSQELLPEEDISIWNGAVGSGWTEKWSWGEVTPGVRDVMRQGQPSIRFVPAAYRGVYLHHEGPVLTLGYDALTFWIHGGDAGGQKINVSLADSGNQPGFAVPVARYVEGGAIPRGAWRQAIVPLRDLRSAGQSVSGVIFADASGGKQPALYLDDIRLRVNPARRVVSEITCRVDATQVQGAISPLIYGIAQPKAGFMEELRLPMTRWGGNPATRYNWERGNVWNTAADYFFKNVSYVANTPANRAPSGVADLSIESTQKYGADLLLTIPAMGWVARDADGASSQDVPAGGGDPVSPGSEAIAGYDPTDNRQRVSLRSLPRKGRPFTDPPDLMDDVVYQDEWVAHLVHKFGKAGQGGVRYYAVDNEPDLWDSTHRDMHPVRADYAEILKRFLDTANAIKDVDAGAQVTGPVAWGWTGFFFSPRDRGQDNFHTYADRKAHGGLAFLPWFLKSVAAEDRKTGRRSLDILDVHFYPQASGVYGNTSDVATNALRLRSVRGLWDKAYPDESWIGAPVALIPRLRQWINRYYPGTKIGLTEWNWGADTTPNGGLAIAEVLGVLGRERVDMAAYWTAPPLHSPGFYAYKMFRNADGAGHGFGDAVAATETSAPQLISCYGSVDTATGQPVVMFVNKTNRVVNAALSLSSRAKMQRAHLFQIGGGAWKEITHLPDAPISGGQTRLSLAPASVTLLRCE